MADPVVYPSLVDVGPSLRPLRIPPPSAADRDDESPQLRRISDGVQRTVFSLDQDVGIDITYTVLLTFLGDGASVQDYRQRDAGGLLPEEIAKTMNVRAASDGEEGLCAVCLDGLGREEEEEEDRTVGILTCRHEFHVSCIRQWLMKKNQCPLCRAVAL